MNAVLKAPQSEGAGGLRTRRGADLPPLRQKYLANATRVGWDEWASFAMAYVFTTAGADPEIQKAMAQWVSYRITSIHPGGKKFWRVVWEFQASGMGPIPSDLYEGSPVLAKKYPWVAPRIAGIERALKDDLKPDAQADAEKDPEVVKLRDAFNQATAAQPHDPRKVAAAKHALDAALTKRVDDLVAIRLAARKEQTWSDDDADEAWIRWPTRLADAGKSTAEKPELVEQETWATQVKSDTKADPAAKGAPAPTKGAPAPAPAKGAPAAAKP
jgi:hypothetical protein